MWSFAPRLRVLRPVSAYNIHILRFPGCARSGCVGGALPEETYATDGARRPCATAVDELARINTREQRKLSAQVGTEPSMLTQNVKPCSLQSTESARLRPRKTVARGNLTSVVDEHSSWLHLPKDRKEAAVENADGARHRRLHVSDHGLLKLIKLPEASGARCLDGSSPALYFRPAANAGFERDFIISMRGGAWCRTVEHCAQRAKTKLGSSSFWSQVTKGQGILSSNQKSNPVFSQMNTAYFMYCDAFSFNGQRLEPIAHQGQQLHFQGRAVLDALVDYLVRHHGLGDARRVLLTGHSAGGLAVYFNADYIHARILKSRRSREPLDFRAAPDAGFFLAQKNLLDGAVPDFYHSIQQAATLANASGHDGCVKAVTSSRTGRSQNASQCLLAAHVLPHMRVPVFIVQSLADPWQLVRSVGLSCSPKATLEARDADNSRGRLPCCDSRSMAALQAHTSSIRAALKSLGFMPSASPSASPSSSQPPSSSSSSSSSLESSSAPSSARTRSLSVKSSSEYAEAARAGLFAPVCMCHTQMFGHFGHTNGTYNHAAVWAITAPSGERVTPARALLDWWLDRRGLGRGRSGHFHFDDSAWPGNALCARFGVAGFSRLPSGQAFDVT